MIAAGEATAYDSIEQARLIEPEHIILRNSPQKKPEEEKKEQKIEKEVEKKEEKKDEESGEQEEEKTDG